MQLKKGSKVKFLNDVGGGRVIEIVNAKMVKIETFDGFDMPCLIDDLILIEEDASSYNSSSSSNAVKKSSNSNQHQPIAETVPVQKHGDEQFFNCIGGPKDPAGDKIDVILALSPADPEHPTDKAIDLYLINDGNYRALYVISKNGNANMVPIAAGLLEPDTKLRLGDIPQNELPLGLNFNVQLIFFKNSEFALKPVEQFNVSVSAIKLLRPGAYIENDFFDEKAMIVLLAGNKIEHEAPNPMMIKDAMLTPKPADRSTKPVKSTPALEEIDLHIEELIDSHTNLSAGEILEIQLARFTTVLDGAIKHKTSNVVFIHGVGNGKLKFEIHKLLDTKYKHVKYQDASFKEYGYGATLVIVK